MVARIGDPPQHIPGEGETGGIKGGGGANVASDCGLSQSAAADSGVWEAKGRAQRAGEEFKQCEYRTRLVAGVSRDGPWAAPREINQIWKTLAPAVGIKKGAQDCPLP